MPRHRSARVLSGADVTVVVPNWNGAGFIDAAIAALRAQTEPPGRIIVVDNASTDGSCQALRQRRYSGDHALAFDVVRLDRNRGFGAAANVGAALATSPLVAILNSDARPEPRWLEALLAVVRDAGDEVWAWGSVLVDGHGRVESAGDTISAAGVTSKRGRGLVPADLALEPFLVLAPAGAAPLMRRDRLWQLGGYDERFFLYCEDLDLSLRAAWAGWSAVTVPAAVVHHDLGRSGRGRMLVPFLIARNAIRCTVLGHPSPAWRPLLWDETIGPLRAALSLRRSSRRPLSWTVPWLAGRLVATAGLPRSLAERRRRPPTVDPARRRPVEATLALEAVPTSRRSANPPAVARREIGPAQRLAQPGRCSAGRADSAEHRPEV